MLKESWLKSRSSKIQSDYSGYCSTEHVTLMHNDPGSKGYFKLTISGPRRSCIHLLSAQTSQHVFDLRSLQQWHTCL